MSDPSSMIHSQLLNHLHLISQHKYPIEPGQIPVNKVLNWLIQAPQIVRDVASVSWQYLAPPRDGTVFLAWQPLATVGENYATDGYVWTDEQKFENNCGNGYIMDLFVQESGYIPNVEPYATHRRVRYRLRSGPLGPQGQSVDPNLEIVHYVKSFNEHHVPAKNLRTHPQTHKLVTERRWLEAQGTPSQRPFMLHDSSNWPRINMPTQGIPANPYQQHMMFNRPGMPPMARAPGPQQPMFNQQGAPMTSGSMGMSPAKRARPSQVGRVGGPGVAVLPSPFDEAILADEENPSLGDMLDLLTPREISATRYQQHHEWMEEILSSSLAISQILPDPLTIGLTGELAGLTEGILDATPLSSIDPNSGQTRRQIGASQVDELEKRVGAYLKQGEEQLASMKAHHAKRMEELSQQKLFAKLERRLAEAPEHTSNGQVVDIIVGDAETAAGAEVTALEEVVCIQKGGILAAGQEMVGLSNTIDIKPSADEGSTAQLDAGDGIDGNNGLDTDGMQGDGVKSGVDNDNDVNMDDGALDEFADFTNLDTAGDALDMFNEEYGGEYNS